MRTLLLSALLIAIPAFARVTTEPYAPMTGDYFNLLVPGPCGGRVAWTTNEGFDMKVYVESRVPCDPPSRVMIATSMWSMTPGEYHVEVHIDRSDEVAESGTFFVRDGMTRDILVHPFAVPAYVPAGGWITVESDQPLCTPECPLVAVDDFYLRREEVKGDAHTLRFRAPEHKPGLVDVKVKTPLGMMTAQRALYYLDRSAEPDPALFERVLLPVVDANDGANGSRWITEAAIHNRSAWAIETFHGLGQQTIAPQSRAVVVAEGHPRGTALLVPIGDAGNLVVSLRVRDLSRQAESFGTQVPVVRERDLFTNGELTLLDVPVDPRARTKLRLYAYDLENASMTAFASVRHEPGHGAREETLRVPMSRSCSGIACAWTPYTGEIDVPAGIANERVAIYVRVGGRGAPAWAFASITNNETQDVTIVAPDGKGGRPCDPCEVPGR